MATQKSNIPALRFPEFKGEWITSTLDGAVTVNPKSKQLPIDFVYIDLGSVKDGQLIYQQTISLDDSPSRAQRLLSKEDILFQIVRPYQKNNLFFDLNGDYVASTGYAQLRAKKSNLKFIYQYLHTENFVRKVNVRCTGTSYPSINSEDLAKIRISYPDHKEEQKKIADFLTAVDQKIAQLTKKKSCLEQYKKGVMQRLFTQRLRFHDTNGNPFPDWEEKKLGALYSWVNTNNLSRDKLTYESGSVQNIHYGDIHTRFHKNFKQSQEVIPFIDGVTVDDFNKESFVKIGDLVIADASEDYADIGKAIEIVELNDIPLVAGLHTYIARPKKNALATGFSSYLFQTFFIRKQIMRLAQGISVLGISKGNLENISLLIPHIKEQQKIADFLTAIDTKITALGNQLTAAQDFKKSLLQKMFV